MNSQIIQIISAENDNPAQFTAQLLDPVHLDPAACYELALLNISFVNCAYTVPHTLRLYYQREDSAHCIQVPAGFYNGLLEVLDVINNAKCMLDQSGLEGTDRENTQVVELQFDACTLRVNFNKNCDYFWFGEDSLLAKLLGATDTIYDDNFGCFERPAMHPDLLTDLLLIECDQVEPRGIANQFTRSLQTLSTGCCTHGRRNEISFKSKLFCPLAASQRLTHLSVRLKPVYGSTPIQLLFGPTVLTLELRESWTFNK